ERPRDFPAFDAVDRRGFIDANLTIVQRLLVPVEEMRREMPDSRASRLSRSMLSRYMGEMFGFLSGRVLGQYDPVLQLYPEAPDTAGQTRLFLVETNLALLAR